MATQGPRIHLAPALRGMGQSATLAINEHSQRLAAEGREVFKLGLGQSPFPVPEPVVAELRAHAHQKDYLPVSGLRSLREAVADYHQRRDGLSCTDEDVLIGPGSKELLFLMQMAFGGDLVLPTPAWVSYAAQANMLGRAIHLLPTRAADGWHLRADELDRLCRETADRPRLLLLNDPCNPTGASHDPSELRELAQVARAHRLLVLADEIYGDLHFAGRHQSIARFYPEGTVVSAGLSKWCGAGGWRLGTFVFPPQLSWLRQAMAAAASETFTSVSAPVQFAAIAAFAGGEEIDRYLSHSRRLLRALARHVAQGLCSAGATCSDAAGGFYLFPDFGPSRSELAARGMVDASNMCRQLLKDTGVAILPGRAFARPEDELTCRLAFVDFDGARALAQLATMPEGVALEESHLRDMCPRVCQALDRWVAWLHDR